jgi:hypothetical protein
MNRYGLTGYKISRRKKIEKYGGQLKVVPIPLAEGVPPRLPDSTTFN